MTTKNQNQNQELQLQLQLKQRLSPQQLILMKLMQAPVMLLEQRIKEELERRTQLKTLTTKCNSGTK
jgi:hypothetical protein